MENEVFIKKLPVALMDDEKILFGETLAKKLDELEEAENHKKQVTSAAKQRVEAIDEEVGRLRGIVRSGKEDREVECRREWDRAKLVVYTIRTDTGEITSTRPMSWDERQQVIGFELPTEEDEAPPQATLDLDSGKITES